MPSAALALVKKGPRGVLVASTRPAYRRQIVESLDPAQWVAEEATGGAEALEKLESMRFSTLLLDRLLPDLDAKELAEFVQAQYDQVRIFLMDSRSGEMVVCRGPSVCSHQEEGHVCSGPANCPEAQALLQILENSAVAKGEAGQQTIDWEEAAEAQRRVAVPPLPGMIGDCEKMTELYRLARLVAPRETTVLVTGETGTGKELVARAIHKISPRCKGPFVVVNCAAIPETLLESELFGHERGAFTGAVQSRLGRIQMARGGTLFLDEIGEVPLSMQAKLLRFLQEGELQRLGSADTVRADVRVVAATNLDLEQRVKDGQFRQDLYYRLAVFPIELPPLRERLQDIAPLAEHFLDLLCRQARVVAKSFSSAARMLLESQPWTGNVRELQHWVERAFILSEDELALTPRHFPFLPKRG